MPDPFSSIVRREYAAGTLHRSDLSADPVEQFKKWFAEAIEKMGHDPQAMTLATADKNGWPSARTVLLKSADENGFVFATNYQSRKGKELAENPRAALLFYWSPLERQVQVRGTISKTSREVSEEIFNARPVGSRLAAMASLQSDVIESREVLEKRYAELEKEFAGKPIPTPDNWGGFILQPDVFEFWQGGVNRLHDRFRYRRAGEKWIIERLAP